MAAANTQPGQPDEPWELGSHVFGTFWDAAGSDAVTRTEYIVIHRTKHFATVQLIGDLTAVFRKRLTLVDGNFLPVRIGGFWLRPNAPTPSESSSASAASLDVAEPVSSSPGPAASG